MLKINQETSKECAVRVKSYLDWKNKEFQARLKTSETLGSTRDILVAFTKPEANLMTLFTSPSPYALEVIEELTKMAEGEPEPTAKVPKIRQVRLPPRTIPVYDKRTKEILYKRSARRDFSLKEQLFIRQADKRKVPIKEMFAKFNETFKPRTESSIVSKKYYVRKHGLTREK